MSGHPAGIHFAVLPGSPWVRRLVGVTILTAEGSQGQQAVANGL
jgi:hypothetical protein